MIRIILIIGLLILPVISSYAQSQSVTVIKNIEKILYDDDKTANNKEYFGWAKPNSATSSAVWKIMRITYTGNDFVLEWAGGTQLYNSVWDNRATTVTYK